MKNIFLIIFVLLLTNISLSQNPIVPPGVYIADPSAHVWKDGNIYIYGSRDESPDYYCSWSYDVLSSSDLLKWTIHKNAFATKGKYDKVPYSDKILYAPDCQYFNGKYYLYYCLASNKETEGVAVSDSPLGPFAESKKIYLKQYNEIDPAVFVDDDGQAYYIWGQFSAKMAKLKNNHIEIDTNTIKDSVLTENEHFFHEGGYMVKRNGIYYFIYAHIGRAGRPTCIGYSTATSPFGPYKYGGVIIDNDHCDPAVWNNHGSIAEFNGQWYVFYHRSTHASYTMRKVCIEPIKFNQDGSIDEVEMTTQGAGGPLNAKSIIDAERACLLYGNSRVVKISHNNEAINLMKNNDAVAYKYIDLNNGVDFIKINMSPGSKNFKIEVKLDYYWKPTIGTINVTGSKDGKKIKTYMSKIKGAKGVRALWLVFKGNPDKDAMVDWITFE